MPTNQRQTTEGAVHKPVLLTAGDVAKMAGVSRATVWNDVRAGRIPIDNKARGPRGHCRFTEKVARAYAEAKRVTPKIPPKKNFRKMSQREKGKDSGFYTLETVHGTFQRWWARNGLRVSTGSREDKTYVLEELKAIEMFIHQLRADVPLEPTHARVHPEPAEILLEAVAEGGA